MSGQQQKQAKDDSKVTLHNATLNHNDKSDKLDLLVKKYLDLERIPEHRKLIEDLVKAGDRLQLERLIGQRLTFGTAGLRGAMGAGFGQMNDLVIIQTSQGLASYLLDLDQSKTREQGVIIGHDARHNSSRFARLAAIAFLQKNIPVYFCDRIIPTPLVAYGVRLYGCCAGIVVTASHNPKNDNGYKVFSANGAQILSPHDKQIQEFIMKDENQSPGALAWEHELILSPVPSESVARVPKRWEPEGGLLTRVYGDLSKSYFSYLENLVGDKNSFIQGSNICITTTAMHGVGHMFLSRALEIAGFEDVFPVELQKRPDPDFSTVKFPNPEESGALDLAFETAKLTNSNLILANDPDADRCGAALYNPRTNYKRVLTGNEIGALLGWWLWHCYSSDDIALADGPNEKESPKATRGSQHSSPPDASRTDPKSEAIKASNEQSLTEQESESGNQSTEKDAENSKGKPSDCYMISTAVSSKFLQSMAQIEGFRFVETLTGFKHMGNIADELVKRGKCVLFAYEEAIGYMVGSKILDKDGISAAIQLARCAAYVSTTYKRTLERHLDWLYTVYGYHFNLNSYYLCTEPATIREIFTDLQKSYPKSFGESRQFLVTRVRDLNNGYDSGTADKKATLPCSSSSYMVTFFISNDITITLRTSGTEPKIKYYSEIVAKLPERDERLALEPEDFNDESQRTAKEEARERLHQVVESVIERCLRPSHYDLEPAD